MKAIDRWKKLEEWEVRLVFADLEELAEQALTFRGASKQVMKERARRYQDVQTILWQIWKEGQR
jgi:hypothetical protein